MAHQESPLEVIVKGAVSGLAGTIAITIGMQYVPQLLQQLGLTEPEQASGDGQEPTAELAERVAEGVLDTSISEGKAETAGQAIHWGYGTAWGAFFAVMQSSLQLPHHVHGLVFGGLVGVVGSTLLPAIGLAPPPTEQSAPENATQIGLHLLYGWVTALTFHLLSDES